MPGDRQTSQSDQFSIRTESPADHDAIDDVVRRAFNDEVTPELVGLIRQSSNCVPAFALVAEDSSHRVLGHIMLSHLDLDDGTQTHQVLTLSPVSVLSYNQKLWIAGLFGGAAYLPA